MKKCFWKCHAWRWQRPPTVIFKLFQGKYLYFWAIVSFFHQYILEVGNATIKSREVVLKVASPFNRKRSVLCVSCSYTILFAFRKDSDEEKNKFQRLLKEAVKWYDGNGGGEQSISQAAAGHHSDPVATVHVKQINFSNKTWLLKPIWHDAWAHFHIKIKQISNFKRFPDWCWWAFTKMVKKRLHVQGTGKWALSQTGLVSGPEWGWGSWALCFLFRVYDKLKCLGKSLLCAVTTHYYLLL